jgi:succinoglycan biosynthesis protein ExoA
LNSTRSGSEQVPKISVIIPVRPGGSVGALGALSRLDYPAEKIEILVAEGTCPPRQRNVAVAHSGGEILYCLDDDSLVSPDLFKRVAAHYQDEPTSVVGGPSLTPSTDGVLQRCIGYALGSFLGTLTMHARYSAVGDVRWASEKELISCNLSLRREVCSREGGFNEDVFPNEETELLSRFSRKGYKMIYDPSASVERSQRESLGELAEQFFGYGKGRMSQMLLHPSLITWLFLLPLFGFVYLVMLPVLVLMFGLWPLLPLSLYLALTVIMTIVIAVREREARAFVFLPLLYPFIHACYGAGLLWELVPRVCRRPRQEERQGTASVNVMRVKGFDRGWSDEGLRDRLHP